MFDLEYLIPLALALSVPARAFPAHASLAGLRTEEWNKALATLKYTPPPPPPGPLECSGTKLVNDADHPFMDPQPGDIRGPCSGLNTLASHGYINRTGITSCSEIITAAMEGFNMENNLARFTCYAAFLVDGNVITDKLSIGGKSDKTGPDPPGPATVAGLSTHNLFEGDTSMTRADAYFGGDNNFNETLFQEFVEYSNRYGGGKYNLTVAGEYRFKRIQDSIATNPTFSFVAPRLFSAYSESVNPINFWVDGRQDDGQLDPEVARSFFEKMRFPDDFHRAARPMNGENELEVLAAHPIEPGSNINGVNTYTPDPTSGKLADKCTLYENHVNRTVRSLYPDPTGDLLDALKINMHYFYTSVQHRGCKEIFPYGQ
ncbi:hypothetical protein AGABI1DRAFT_118546 [Agaricus bisporus var. burnettii JB137-S8]|uniref:Heme haloperoxidase family profile domain-containing protein n=1 Tax=Agaricus bisporus var. burnettii (strain JB137-S8 / ATCC MYA-4627 / FGSC 10392) TaxID=597362 RepID=K5Y567_AGABU|nr:uncharacterized protein AGABI1DRAFT_118546 [Agaricus bisporus var. burnettii JB137-S8]EKM83225.1 hypothetical protein AGABI1DRAFT_118546 [Agaricus bisporus var. burnettii JB137-S8]